MAGFRDDGRLYVSASSLETTAHCSTRIWLTVNGYTTKVEAPELLAGVAIHATFEAYFKTGSRRHAIQVFDARYKEWALKNLQWFQRLRYDSVQRITARWLDEHPLEKLPYRAYPGLIEKILHWPLTDDGQIVLVMRPDLVCYIGHTSGIGIVDHKSTKTINQYFVDSFDMSAQITTYWWGIEQILEEPVVAFYINAIELPKLPEMDDQRRCKQHRTWRGKCAHQHPKFHVFTQRRSPGLVAQWHKDAVRLARNLQEVLTIAPDISHLHKVPMDGMFRGHCKWCPFEEFCKNQRPVNRIHEYLMESPLTTEERRAA